MSPDDFQNDTHPGNPQSWNLYAYARNNPLRFIDPTGEVVQAYDANGTLLCKDLDCQFDEKSNLIVGDKKYNTAQYTFGDPSPSAQVTVQLPKNYPLIEPGLGDMTPDLAVTMMGMAGLKVARTAYQVLKQREKYEQQVTKGPPVNPQKQAGHDKGTPQYRNRVKQGTPTSAFDDAASAERFTQEAWQKGTPLPGKPSVREYDFGYRVGTGPKGGVQTRVRVHQDSDGTIHGHPSGPEKF